MTATFTLFDATAYHDYVLTGDPNHGTYNLYVDGVLRLSGLFSSAGGALNGLQLGDGASLDGNAHAEVTRFVFSQPATFSPPPVLSCSPSGFLPLFDVTIALKKNQQRAIPVKMMLNDAAGVTITDATLTPPVINVEYSATVGGVGTDVTSDLLPLGSANTDNLFRFDPATQAWIYNLGTKFFARAGTYTVTAKPGDASHLIDASCTGVFVRLP